MRRNEKVVGKGRGGRENDNKVKGDKVEVR